MTLFEKNINQGKYVKKLPYKDLEIGQSYIYCAKCGAYVKDAWRIKGSEPIGYKILPEMKVIVSV